MTNAWNDFNDARQNAKLIPKGTIAKVRLTIRPGGFSDPAQGWTGGYAKRGSTGAVYLDAEYTVLEGQYAKRKIWSMIGLYSPKGPDWANMGRSLVRGILNSARGLSDKDNSPEAQNARRIAGLGDLDGLGRYGPRMRAAILAFRADNGLGLSPDVDPVLAQALQRAKPRAVSRERAEGKPKGSRIVKAADAQIVSGVVGMAGAAASVVVPAVETAERAKDVTERTVGLLNLSDWLLPVLPWAGAAIFLIVILLAWRAKAARIEDHRTGKTP